MIKRQRFRAHSAPIASNLNLMNQNGFNRDAGSIIVVDLQRDFVRRFFASCEHRLHTHRASVLKAT